MKSSLSPWAEKIRALAKTYGCTVHDRDDSLKTFTILSPGYKALRSLTPELRAAQVEVSDPVMYPSRQFKHRCFIRCVDRSA